MCIRDSPVVSPAYTAGLKGTPNEIKLKYLADNNFSHLSGEEQKKAIAQFIKNKETDLLDRVEAVSYTHLDVYKRQGF